MLKYGIVICYYDFIHFERINVKRTAFTLIELIFVIVVLGILAAVAIPRIGGNVVSAQIAKAQGDVSAIRASIASARLKLLVTGKNAYPSALDNGATTAVGQTIFDNNGTGTADVTILTYPVYTKSDGWMKVSGTTSSATSVYSVSIDSTAVPFTYTAASGTFDCVHDDPVALIQTYCKRIAE